jgi:hypothetical protein
MPIGLRAQVSPRPRARDDSRVSDESAFVSQEDIEALNRTEIQRIGHLAQRAGAALVAVGVVCIVAWAWLVVRQQLNANGGGAFTLDHHDEIGLAGRVDILLGTFSFVVEGTLAIAVGFAIRLFSAFLLSRDGVSVTSFEVGDPFPLSEEPPD